MYKVVSRDVSQAIMESMDGCVRLNLIIINLLKVPFLAILYAE